MNVLDVLTLVAVVVATKEKTPIDPVEFFGIEGQVKALIESPNQAIRDLLKEYAGVNWDGKTRLVETILANAKLHCETDRILAQEGVSERRYQDAIDILKYDRAIPGTLADQVVKDAQSVVNAYQKRQEEKSRKPGEDQTEPQHESDEE